MFLIRELGMSVTHPQDVLVILKLVANRNAGKSATYAQLGEELSTSASQVFRAVQRAKEARLLNPLTVPPPPGLTENESHEDESAVLLQRPNPGNLKEFLIHGVKYVFPAKRGGPTRGIPTAEAASPLAKHFSQDFALPPVWPHPNGSVRGIEFSPLHKSVPQAALRDQGLYELLALVDAIREGRAREREIAIRELIARIDPS